jgi:hypothetical protein
MTLDGLWHYLHTDHELIWLQPDDVVPERERHMIQSQKMMQSEWFLDSPGECFFFPRFHVIYPCLLPGFTLGQTPAALERGMDP